jgi:hypothetical protein
MGFLSVELNCPDHGLERFKIPVVKRFNMESDEVYLVLRKKPKPGELKKLLVGRDVSEDRIKEVLQDYLRTRGLWERIIRMQLII